ncbi:hypothetical protein ACIQTZ_12915 [Paenarthrobacter sp. NPDC090520]|uniref:hypothetical protein n=1 Tax=unclassified Paenarthrobacter TaxID=2634190 RepID=UPI0037F1F654
MDAELTVQQAAEMLTVSSSHILGLLTSGQVKGRESDSRWLVEAESLLEYKGIAAVAQKAAADELSALAQEMKLI